MAPDCSASLLYRYFTGLTEYAFQVRLGVADPPVTDYLASLLVRFIRSDLMYRLRSPEGRRLVDISNMLEEANQRTGSAKREVHRHIGDFTLFWAGIFPETLKSQKKRGNPDRFQAYLVHGKQSYYIASTMPAHAKDSEVLQRLSDNFDLCTYGLSEVRREWERKDEAGDSPLPFLID